MIILLDIACMVARMLHIRVLIQVDPGQSLDNNGTLPEMEQQLRKAASGTGRASARLAWYLTRKYRYSYPANISHRRTTAAADPGGASLPGVLLRAPFLQV